jgi:hypothetical protein
MKDKIIVKRGQCRGRPPNEAKGLLLAVDRTRSTVDSDHTAELVVRYAVGGSPFRARSLPFQVRNKSAGAQNTDPPPKLLFPFGRASGICIQSVNLNTGKPETGYRRARDWPTHTCSVTAILAQNRDKDMINAIPGLLKISGTGKLYPDLNERKCNHYALSGKQN